MDKKILVLDIDGTLVNSKKEITPGTKEALFRIQEEGHVVALASGRPYPGMKKYVKEAGLSRFGGYAISFNGGIVKNCLTGEVMPGEQIEQKYAKILYDYAMEKGIGMMTYQGDTVITGTEIDEYMLYETRLNHMILYRVKDFCSYVDFDMIKCMMTAEPEKAEICEKELKLLLKDKINVFRSEPYFIEITANGVDKAKAVERLIKKLEIPRENCICCGDGFNDLTMISFAGIGVAMENAQQIVKENADYITSSCDEDGIVRVIDRFFSS